MKKVFHCVVLAALVLASLAACTTNSLSGASYVRQEARQAQVVDTATVVAVRAVMIEPHADGTNLGAAIGAVAGGFIGNRIGGGNGKIVASVLGAALGGVAGQKVGHALTTVPGVEITYLRGDRTYSVVQEADGTRFVVGETVRIISGSGWGGTTRVARL